MTVIEKDYRCEFDRDDVLTVAVNTEDQDVTLSIEGPEVILNEKKIRKLIKQLKKALPKKEEDVDGRDPGFNRESLEGNVNVGDRVVVQFSDLSKPLTGLVVETDFEDSVMPLKLHTDEGRFNWPWLEKESRVFKIN